MSQDTPQAADVRNKMGTVYLVGAGPGDPGLITVKGLRYLRQADVVLYDALVSRELLDEVPPAALRVDVGKRPGNHGAEQEEINRLLIEMARQHRTVVRLKGGDPFVFGRGGEELQALLAAGIPVEVVPGVTSATAALACAGVPVTYRGVGAGFAVISGHRAAELEEDYPWPALAQMDTLVVLMGLKHLDRICRHLLAAGRDPDTPAMAVRSGSTPEQEVVTGTLGTIAARVAARGLGTPAVIAIGKTVGLAGQLGWFPGPRRDQAGGPGS